MSPRPLIHDAEHWRKRAEEARTLADRMTDLESRRVCLRLPNHTRSWRLARKSEIKTNGSRELMKGLSHRSALWRASPIRWVCQPSSHRVREGWKEKRSSPDAKQV